jgi:hypothetical protein
MQTYDKQRARDSQARAVRRGVAAVVALVLTAVDALVTARLGLPRLAWMGRRVGRELAEEYRRGYHDARDAEVIDEENE